MSHKVFVALTVASLSLMMLFAGCIAVPIEPAAVVDDASSDSNTKEAVKIEVESPVAPAVEADPVFAQIALKINSGDSSTYKSSFEVIQDYKFEQPSINKIKVRQNLMKVETTFLQKVESVDKDLTAVVKITLKDILIYIKDRDGVKYDFDSERTENKQKAFSDLIGKSYTINVTSDGKVRVADTSDIRTVTMADLEGQILEDFLGDGEIIKRHEIISLPNKAVSTVEVGKGWSKVVPSHPKLLEQKSFEKNYILESINDDSIATVKMTAYESDKTADGPAAQGKYGVFAKMFDTQEKYRGEMKFDLKSGKVINLKESFTALYIASDMTVKNTDEDLDTLTMGLTHTISFEKID